MLKHLEPILWVTEIEASVAFYEKLGFSLRGAVHRPDGRIEHAEVENGDVRLMLGYKQEDGPLGGGPELYIGLDDVDGYYARVRAAGAPIADELADQFWGDRTFRVTDPDGYNLTFAQTVRGFDPACDMPAAAPA